MRLSITVLSLFLTLVIANPLTKLKGAKEIVLSNGHWEDCSGTHISVRIKNPATQKICTTVPKDVVWANTLVRWTGADLNDCISMPVNLESEIYFITPGSDGFCPRRTTIRMNDETDTLWETYGNMDIYEFFTQSTNTVGHGLTKRWPLPGGLYVRNPNEPLNCPKEEDDTCRAKDMLAYKIAGRKQMNCIFECPSLTSINMSTDYLVTNATGFRCLETKFDAVQFDWCCKTKRTLGGIPFCPDVVSNEMLNQLNMEENTDEDEEGQCPAYGCPIENVKTFNDRNAGKVKENCQIQNQCDFVLSENGSDPNSGVKCTPTKRAKRKLNLCCDDPNANSDLIQCSARKQT